jgi:ABC-2 type transport system ATP-binding protein
LKVGILVFMKAIDVRNLTKIYRGNIKAVDNLSFEVAEGSIFGFLGPNGAGKSTTIKILITLARPTQGTAHIFDLDVIKEPSKVRGVIGYVPQELSADGALTGYENLLLSAKLYDIPAQERKTRIDAILGLLDLSSRAHSLVDTYSGGMIRRLEIGQAMLHRPMVLFLDEPTIGLDPSGRKLVWEHIRKLNFEEHMTIFLTTHYMEEAEALCDQIGIIDRGRLSVVGSPQQLKEKVGVGTVTFVLDPKNNDSSASPAAMFRDVEGVSVSQLALNTWQLKISHSALQTPEILRTLIQQNLPVSDLEVRGPSLEDVFLKYTGSRFDEESSHSEWKAIKGRRRTVRRVR